MSAMRERERGVDGAGDYGDVFVIDGSIDCGGLYVGKDARVRWRSLVFVGVLGENLEA